MLTPEGMQSQLLNVVVNSERQELQTQKENLIRISAENAAKLEACENRILHTLSSAQGNLLEDETAVNVLRESKRIADDIKLEQAKAATTEIEIDVARKQYQPVAVAAQRLFFCVRKLAFVEPVYEFSLAWFFSLLQGTLHKSGGNNTTSKDEDSDISSRINYLNKHFRRSTYRNVCRSLLSKDKLLFPFLILVSDLHSKNNLDYREWRFLLTGNIGSVNTISTNASEDDSESDVEESKSQADGTKSQNPPEEPLQKPHWIRQNSWRELLNLCQLNDFRGIAKNISSGLDENAWNKYCSAEAPENISVPVRCDLSPYQQILLLRCIRPDRLVFAIERFVAEELGEEFTQPPNFDLGACIADSSSAAPLIFILSPGSDPMTPLLKFAAKKKIEVNSVSLGQGQGVIAEGLVRKGRRNGSWVMLQNCHLIPSWLPRLEYICEQHDDASVSTAFRIFCTTYPTPDFPVSVLQNAVKITMEPPKGLRANILRSYLSDPIIDIDFFESLTGAKGEMFRAMLYALCLFHAVVQERCRYGAIGWNIPYEFNESDLRISMKQLLQFIGDTADDKCLIPLKALRYTVGECNYGGRVTDDNDRETIRYLLARFYCEEATQQNHSFSEDDTSPYVAPLAKFDHKEYVKFIEELPQIESATSIIGLHTNAQLFRNGEETKLLLSNIVKTELSLSSSGRSEDPGSDESQQQEDPVVVMTESILKSLPNKFDVAKARIKYPIKWEESMNTVLVQEMGRYNNLLDEIQTGLIDVANAIRGVAIMSQALEEVARSIELGKVPRLFLSKSYPSLKPLSSYFQDLNDRLEFLRKWADERPPVVYWISGFFFTQAFITGSMQNFARRSSTPIDQVGFNMQFMKKTEYTQPPKTGVYINGLFFEGGEWDPDAQLLADCSGSKIICPAPTIMLRPVRKDKVEGCPFACPVYRTSERRGQLSTTGLSTNFVMIIRVPTKLSQAFWKMRGTAMLCALSE